MNVLILFSIKVCDNPEANSFKTFFCCFIFFLCGKIISPKIIGWFLHDYHILSVRNLDHIYHMKNWLVWCLTIFFQAAYCPREFHPSEVLSELLPLLDPRNAKKAGAVAEQGYHCLRTRSLQSSLPRLLLAWMDPLITFLAVIYEAYYFTGGLRASDLIAFPYFRLVR